MDIKFIERRIEEHKAKNLHLEKEIKETEEEMVHRTLLVQEASERLAVARSNKSTASSKQMDPLEEKIVRYNKFIDYITENFAYLRGELIDIYNISITGSSDSENNEEILDRMQDFIQRISEINDNLITN